jgi:hypothetical protein
MIDPEIFSKLTNWFYAYRLLRTAVPKGNKFRDDEKLLAFELSQLTADEIAYMRDYFYFNGFMLESFDWTEHKGIPEGGKYWGLVRVSSPLRTDESLITRWVSPVEARKRLAYAANESKGQSTVWTFVIYMHYLHLTYTKLGRHPSEISRYVDAVFSKEELVAGVQRFVDGLGERHANETAAVGYLTVERGHEIETRVSRFLEFLETTNSISFNSSDNAYSQTILGAAEVSEHFDGDISYLIPSEKLDEQSLEQIVLTDEHDASEETLEGGI